MAYKITIKLGDGVKSISYGVNTTNIQVAAATKIEDVDVGSGGYIYIAKVNYESTHTYPVTASDGSKTFTVVNTNGNFNDHYVSAPSSSGTRTVTLTATKQGGSGTTSAP